ncbi:Hypothetical protein PBC10988_2430 [Planctomycetales bacterium 10988]|nr:Hypothetical protein PBC10988_2430 [Planctomycetales bacterium 10988]
MSQPNQSHFSTKTSSLEGESAPRNLRFYIAVFTLVLLAFLIMLAGVAVVYVFGRPADDLAEDLNLPKELVKKFELPSEDYRYFEKLESVDSLEHEYVHSLVQMAWLFGSWAMFNLRYEVEKTKYDSKHDCCHGVAKFFTIDDDSGDKVEHRYHAVFKKQNLKGEGWKKLYLAVDGEEQYSDLSENPGLKSLLDSLDFDKFTDLVLSEPNSK